ncbi:glycosyltransferase family 4 protein [Salinimicrobium tongyeongense]|uniref:Glycosyltransferase family 4 protein n=1 Tax=Salinimicrobium tongyeongense TaxID=2809707 RepID=A0ABY6NPZ6_9FLAO|nr:glycosyltransferase family 1 protein [Salinimicrobium tongyeongense]UZH54648.1 glycosyltransferase family 4 protein [Salinimicrobium tongyeongense]
MRLGIDASNLSRGGGVTHLVEFLESSRPSNYQVEQVIVWGSKSTLGKIKDKEWLLKVNLPVLEKALPYRIYWQSFGLEKELRARGCDALFVPGGTVWSNFSPTITMCRNMLPFQTIELKRYGFSLHTLKFRFLRIIQKRSFKKAEGLIYLNEFAKKNVSEIVGKPKFFSAVIPHGINARFKGIIRPNKKISRYSEVNPFKILYVSIVDVYKHQWGLVRAVEILRAKGFPLELILVGPSYPPALKKLEKSIEDSDPSRQFVKYMGAVSYEELHKIYSEANLNVFASSCENMPNILLEAMASGLPIACSNKGPMPEILKDGGLYFDPENPLDIAKTIEQYLLSPSLRDEKAYKSFNEVNNYSWEKCADETWAFINKVATTNPVEARNLNE